MTSSVPVWCAHCEDQAACLYSSSCGACRPRFSRHAATLQNSPIALPTLSELRPPQPNVCPCLESGSSGCEVPAEAPPSSGIALPARTARAAGIWCQGRYPRCTRNPNGARARPAAGYPPAPSTHRSHSNRKKKDGLKQAGARTRPRSAHVRGAVGDGQMHTRGLYRVGGGTGRGGVAGTREAWQP